MKTFLLLLLLFPLTVLAELSENPSPAEQQAQARLPLQTYNELLQASRKEPHPAPLEYALGNADVQVSVSEKDDRMIALVSTQLSVQTFEDEWTLVPILPLGTALFEVSANGRPVQLAVGPDGLSWSSKKAAQTILTLKYGVTIETSESGFSVPVPIPHSAVTTLHFSLPGTRLDPVAVPSANLKITPDKDNGITYGSASIPQASSVLISWRSASKRPYILSRAHYQGELQNKSIAWKALYDLQVFSGESITLPLMPAGTILSDIRLDGKAAPVLQDDGHFATLVQGRGAHQIEVRLQTAVQETKGPLQTIVNIPQVPVSRFELSLPGRKELKVFPEVNVSSRNDNDNTHASLHIPMSKQVRFSWVDAIPQDLKAELRANATLYHAVYAEEGVLHVQGMVNYEITHGETSTLSLQVPANVQINRISSADIGVSDWAVEALDDHRQKVTVYLDRELKANLLLQVAYERLLGSGEQAQQAVEVPLMHALNVHRQRGMVALLAAKDLTLKPQQEQHVTLVGENQLPSFVRNPLHMTIAHTFKYISPQAALLVKAVAPEHKQGIFDAQVDTLISIGEVTLKGSAMVRIDVKSGSIMKLMLKLPENINILGVSAPSLRSHEVRQEGENPHIELDFTQEMEGQFSLQVDYERIMQDSVAQARVPTLSVADAEVEHGRIAVEALTAVEVTQGQAEQLSSLDIN
ncbi:MAG: hypothetical protein KZQ58_08645 [gamma proteobacterium symbiont of Bathyaustriella thionipta]|nr:hypothetical protein [gamma proteobacterium symbiont of Bathyaustriella thionipta]